MMNERSQSAAKFAAMAQTRTVSAPGPGTRRVGGLLATASLVALLCGMPGAAAADCASGAPPTEIATPAMLYETLRARTSAQLLAIGFLQKPVADECTWIYEVKMLTASGSVVELDFAADDLELIGARGPDNDRDAAALVRGFSDDATVLKIGSPSGSGGDDDGGGEGSGGEGGSSGGGSGGSGSGGGGSGGSGSGGGGDDGGEGGGDDGGEGGGDDGGEGGGDDGGGEGGGGEGGGGEGGDSDGGGGGDD